YVLMLLIPGCFFLASPSCFRGAESLLAFLLKMLSERSRQLYAQEAACRLQTAERDGKSLQRLSKEEFCKMLLPDSPPGEDRSRKVRSLS
ncbi:hypothetical protein XENOCAPTIV_021364, partial [Xenoophorus captivus]